MAGLAPAHGLVEGQGVGMSWHPDIPLEYRNQIVTGDARELAKRIPDESVGLIVTSPPYNVRLNYEGYDDNLSNDKFIEFNQEWLIEALRVTCEGGRLYAIVSDSMLWWFKSEAEKIGWTFAQKLVWCKPNFVGSAGKITNDWNYMTEDILLFRKGKRSPMKNGNTTTHNWFVETVPQSNYREGRIHPAQLPVSLCMRLLDRTPGEPTLDPFAGSGSVLLAAKILGRSYIGFELVDKVAERARQRVQNTQPPLFVPQPQQLEFGATDEAG